jgi:hypothetical protein
MKPRPRLSSRLWGTFEANSISVSWFLGLRAQEKVSAHVVQTLRSARHGTPEARLHYNCKR